MRTRTEVSAEKLRGGFYTPPALVRFCLRRALDGARPANGEAVRLLEPTCGDGAFLRGLPSDRKITFTAVEIDPTQAAIADIDARAAGQLGEVHARSVLRWALEACEPFDVAVGNPPFVRFQFVAPDDRSAAERVAARAGLELRGVSNLWIPVLLASLTALRAGGRFAFVLPAELMTGLAASDIRQWLLEECEHLQLDLFASRSFPDVLQEVVVLSGVRGRGTRPCRVSVLDWDALGVATKVDHSLEHSPATWTELLLAPATMTAYRELVGARPYRRLGDVATFEVSTVTGANTYFSLTAAEARERGLEPWGQPLLPRIRHAPGLAYTHQDADVARDDAARTVLLDFDSLDVDSAVSSPALRYIEHGEDLGLSARFKCRTRTPWYAVPVVKAGALLLSKRSHRFPRVVVNEADAVTTDTIYRGRILDPSVSARSFTAGFHNSATLLGAELEGRSFGGGVLELVPSEIRRLFVPCAETLSAAFDSLDREARAGSADDLVRASNRALVGHAAVSAEMLSTLDEARLALVDRRMRRNGPPRAANPAAGDEPAYGAEMSMR